MQVRPEGCTHMKHQYLPPAPHPRRNLTLIPHLSLLPQVSILLPMHMNVTQHSACQVRIAWELLCW